MGGWERPYFERGEDPAFAFFVIFGQFGDEIRISPKAYNFSEMPENTEVVRYSDDDSPEYRDAFRSGVLWNRLGRENPTLASDIFKAPECMVLRAELPDQENLHYLRNLIGLVTYFLDHGGVGLFDPLQFKWWEKDEWRKKVFEPGNPVPSEHVLITVSDQENGQFWVHTRGLRLFGRPDLSIRDVPNAKVDRILDMFNQFIHISAFGGHIPTHKKLDLNDLPDSMWCELGGDFADPDFNNKHLKIFWN